MVIVDRAGRIAAVNEQTTKMFGFGRDELMGKPVEMLVPYRFSATHASQRHDYSKDPKIRPMGAMRDLCGRHKDGTEIPVEISLGPLRDRGWQPRLRGDPGRDGAQAARGDPEQESRAARGAVPADPGSEPAQERVPREHVARAEDSAERRDRVRGAPSRRQGGNGHGRPEGVSGRHPDERAAPPPAHQRRARPREGRSREDGVPKGALSTPRASPRRCATRCVRSLPKSGSRSRSR